MKSSIASLRELTLPFGATEGARIVLNGTEGIIQVYDTNNDLLLEINPILVGTRGGLAVYDPDGNIRADISTPYSGAYSGVLMWTAAASEDNPGLITLADSATARSNRLVIAPGTQGKGSLEWTICAAPRDNASGSLLQAIALTLNDPGNQRPIIDLTGAGAPSESVRPYTVVHDLWLGTPNGFAQEPTRVRPYPQGTYAYDNKTTDVTLSTTAGTYTEIMRTTAFTAKTGRRYKITLSGGMRFVVGGSGFAAGDAWAQKCQVSVNAGAYGELAEGGREFTAVSQAAASGTFHIPTLIAYYTAVGNDSLSFRWLAAKLSGAVTVTTTYQADGGAAPFRMHVEEVGT